MALIEIKNLTKRYGKKEALKHVSLEIEAGQIVGLLGPNGSGKTTLIKILCGLLSEDEGEIRIGGERIGISTKEMISFLPDRPVLPESFRIRELIAMYADFFKDFNTQKAEAMLLDLNLEKDMRLAEMSKGMREKVQLILTMARDARVYLLDEPIGGVDPAAREYILRTILNNYNPEAVVMISTHLIADVESVLDDVIMVRDGEILRHENAEIMREKENKSIDELFREVFRC